VSGLNLRTRLYVVLGALFLVPVLVGGLVLVFVIPTILNTSLDGRIPVSSDAVRSEISDDCMQLGLAARSVALESGVAALPLTAVKNAVDGHYASYAALLRSDGTVLVEAGDLPPGAGLPARLPSCFDSRGAGPVIAASVRVRGGVAGAALAVATRSVNSAFVDRLVSRAGADGDVVLLRGSTVVAASLPAGDARNLATTLHGRHALVHVGGRVTFVSGPGNGVPYTVIVTAQKPKVVDSIVLISVLILVAGAAVAGLLVTIVARGLSQPFADLTEVAERVAERAADGDFGNVDAIVDEFPQGEAGRLGEAFNRVATELRRNMSKLEQSKEDLRESLERIGDTLWNTHDMEGLVQAVLDAAVVTLQARAGVVLYGAPDELRLVASHGLHEAGLNAPAGIAPGEGVLGLVVSTGRSVRGTIGSGPPELAPVDTEPKDGDILATPLRSMGSVIGVLALYGREDGGAFDDSDDGALLTLAKQAGRAIDNVQLHQEAQRLSTTDGLTGLWNFRYLSSSLAREIERSTRFQRPLAVLMLDLDNFKQVNDNHGHARGDSVLRELAFRVQEQIREVDTFARYGGEEFVVVLPETTVEGAAQLADRICDAVRLEPFQHEGEEPLDITVSVGGAAFPNHGASAATLMRAADKALYVAKAEGKDRWHMPDASPG
jgi:two-component system, cell cycle response regulator